MLWMLGYLLTRHGFACRHLFSLSLNRQTLSDSTSCHRNDTNIQNKLQQIDLFLKSNKEHGFTLDSRRTKNSNMPFLCMVALLLPQRSHFRPHSTRAARPALPSCCPCHSSSGAGTEGSALLRGHSPVWGTTLI